MNLHAGLLLAALIPAVLVMAESNVAVAAGRRPLKVEDLFAFQRVADPQLSPDGKEVAYVVTSVDLPGNRSTSHLWIAPTDPSRGGPRQLTTAGKKDRHPRWSPDGRQILFESNRSGDFQLWVISPSGGEAKQVTNIATEAANGVWSPDGTAIAFVSAVYPEFSEKPFAESDDLNKKKKEEAARNPVKARVFTKLFFRHWDEWVEDKRQHVFVVPAAGGSPRDLTPGDRDTHPTSTTFGLGDDLTFSPDGQYIVYTAPPQRDEAWSTNYDIWRVSVSGGAAECLTKDNAAADGAPQFSPDGKWLAYRAQQRPGFEADRWQLMLLQADGSSKPRSITASLDASPESYVWDDKSNGLYFVAEDKASTPIYHVSIADGKIAKLTDADAHSNDALSAARNGKLAFTRAALNSPAEVYVGAPAEAINISQANTKLLSELDLSKPESVTVTGAAGAPMQMWILKPPGFDQSKKWPLAFLVHGGPQGAWADSWSYRWNPELWAAQGYVVALPNPRGSTGFGQKYVDEISGDWGGKCYDDLMAGLAYLEKLPFIDRDRMAAAGASFGGYMMNWFQGHTNKFKTLISHCGVYNFDSMYALTEELWFDEWEHGGPPWANRESYEKHSPHKFAKNFKTPMLIIHNDLDFRVPVAEGLQMFTTLQRLGVPSRMVNFPDEGHWVLKPANSLYWHKEVFGWLAKYAPPGGK